MVTRPNLLTGCLGGRPARTSFRASSLWRICFGGPHSDSPACQDLLLEGSANLASVTGDAMKSSLSLETIEAPSTIVHARHLTGDLSNSLSGGLGKSVIIYLLMDSCDTHSS